MPQTIAIVAPSSVPFVVGGAEKFWWGLYKGLTEYTDAFVELIKIPCREQNFHEIVQSYKTFSELDLSHFDKIISTKYPAWMVRHSHHVVYLQHTLRGLYDTYHFTGLPETLLYFPEPLRELLALVRKEQPDRNDVQQTFSMLARIEKVKSLPSELFAFPGPLIRELVHFFDRVALAPGQVVAYAAISETVKNRQDYFPPNTSVKVIHHPSDMTRFTTGSGDYIFTASRLMGMKRLDLIVKAMRQVTVDIPLRIAGTGPELAHLKALAGDDPRIEFLGFVPDTQLADLYAHARFVPFVPYDEDYGLITIEAMRSAKPVVTVTDAGGVREFVINGETGYCVEPTPEAVGEAMQKLAADPELAARMGRQACELVSGITWQNTVKTLLGHAAGNGRKKVLVVSTFPADNPVFGGQKRLFHLCRALSRTFFVQLVCLGKEEQSIPIQTELDRYVSQLSMPWSPILLEEIARLKNLTSASIDDIASMNTCAKDEALLNTLQDYGSDADWVVASHPYLYPALNRLFADKPLIYDAHNMERDMKAAILEDCPACAPLLEQVFAIEQTCCRAARAILACSENDAHRFTELYGVASDKIHLVSNGYDAKALSYLPRSERRKLKRALGCNDMPLALFMGSGHRPNVEAVQTIKQVAALVPEVQFLIAGKVCEAPGLDADVSENLHFLGVVPEEEKNMLLYAADFGLNPVISGSGTNLKIIEYVASGLETLSTSFGLRGLDDTICANVRTCEPEALAETLREALRHPLAADRLETAARRAEAVFSWEAAMSPVQGMPETLFPVSEGDKE